jgi:hypothetical protein
VPRTQFFTDAAAGHLPNVSWVIPSIADSEHPPYNVTTGEQWGMNVIQAVEDSPEWNSTVLFITWDEYGGFYDSVPPPVIDGVGLSFRVPLLIISPYVRENYIDHNFGYFESLLKLVEWRNGLTNLTARDLEAALPLQAFDFQAKPRAPISFASAVNASYPEMLQSLPPPYAPTNVTVSGIPGGLRILWTPPVGGTAPSYYRLYYYPKGTPMAQSIRIDGAADGFVLKGLAVNTTYFLNLQSATSGNYSAPLPVKGRTLQPSPAEPLTAEMLPSGSALSTASLVAPSASFFDARPSTFPPVATRRTRPVRGPAPVPGQG